MSDNKTIQDALAEVQRNIDEAAATILDPSGKKLGTTEYQRVPGSTVGKTAVSTAGKTAGRSMLGRAASILGGPAVAGALTAAEVLKPTPAGETKSEFERQKEMGIAPKPMSSISPAPKTSTGRTGVGINKVMNRGKETPAEPLKMAKVEPKTFSQAFSAARKAASEKGSPASGQFEFKGKTYQTNVKGEKYVAPPKQTAVSTTKEVPLPPKKPDDLAKPTTSGVDKPMSSVSPAPSTPTSSTPKFETKPFVKNTSDGVSRPTDAPSKISAEPVDTSKPSSSKLTNLEYESGGKKKKMSEDTNPLIAAFLKLQENNPSNMFEAAKKAKKDYDKDGKIESPKDEVWGSRFRAAKMAGKMEEGMIDPKDPSVQGSGDVTSTPEKPAKPVAPKKVDRDPSYQGSGEVTKSGKPASVREDEQIDERNLLKRMKDTMRLGSSGKERVDRISGALSDRGGNWDYKKGDFTEKGKSQVKSRLKNVKGASDYALNKEETQIEEVEFSQAEIDHINSFFEQVAPGRPEPTKGVNPTVRNIDLTDENLEEGRPKKNPTPETSERDARQHIQVIAGRAAAGNTLDFPHNDGSKSKITPAMGRKIVAHLQGLKPADRQTAVNKMHDSAEGLKV